MTTISDENGWQWLVMPVDPAGGLVKLLKKAGYRKIVLPRSTIRTGSLPDTAELPDLPALQRGYESVEHELDEQALKQLSQYILLQHTLTDCYWTLAS